MIRARILPLLQNEYSMFRPVLSSTFHMSQIANRKCCKREQEKSCEPVSVAVVSTYMRKIL